MNLTYKYEWRGKAPDCLVVRDGVILDQNVFNEALTDMVKGHLYDLNHDKCLVHEHCNCHVLVTAYIKLDSGFTHELYGTVPMIREKAEAVFMWKHYMKLNDAQIEALLKELSGQLFWKNILDGGVLLSDRKYNLNKWVKENET